MTEVWGNACWRLFHVSAVNLKEDHQHLVSEILGLIYVISVNLPCPVCSEHAKITLSKLNKSTINDKEKLITCLWQFHNIVNKNTQSQYLTREKHDELYKEVNIHEVLIHWLKVMTKSWIGGDPSNMMHTLFRKKMIERVVFFYKKNKNAFMRY